MEDVRISVVIPAYNAERTVARCLSSILAQTHRDLEVIVVDDGSSDGTAAVCERYAETDRRVKFVRAEHGGALAARLTGVARAVGGWIAFADADDAMDEDLLGTLLVLAEARNADIAVCGFRIEGADGKCRAIRGTGRTVEYDRDGGIRALLRGDFEPTLCAKLYRRELFDAVPAELDRSVRYNEDLYLNFYLLRAARRSVWRDVCPYRYLARADSVSHGTPNGRRVADPIRVRELLLADAPASCGTDVLRAYLNALIDACHTLAAAGGSTESRMWRSVRDRLNGRRDDLGCLGLKRRLTAQLILRRPRLYRLLYRFYRRFFFHDPYEVLG